MTNEALRVIAPAMWTRLGMWLFVGLYLFTGSTRFDRRYWEFYRIVLIFGWLLLGYDLLIRR